MVKRAREGGWCTLPSTIASSRLRSLSYSCNRSRIGSTSYSSEACRKRIVFSRIRLESDSGVVEAKYDRNGVVAWLDVYEATIHESVTAIRIDCNILVLPFARQSFDIDSSFRQDRS